MPSSEVTNPYVGPVPFDREKKEFFFGREKETKKLLSLAISERVVLFYSQSGAGKSSLINAGLIPGLKDYDYWTLPIARVGGELPPDLAADRVGNIYVFNVLSSLAGSRKNYKELVGRPLSSLLTDEMLSPQAQPHWLIIDQFEEILTTHPEQYEQREEFFLQLRKALDADKMLSVVLAMREDYIAGLDNYASLLPGRLEVRFRMEPLRRAEAEQAVKRPAEKAGRQYAPGVAESLVRELSLIRVGGREGAEDSEVEGGRLSGRFVPGEYVEPVQLQIVCFDLWKRLEKSGAGQVIHEYGDIDTALESYYNSAVEETARRTKILPNSIRRWFEEKLITPTGIRSQVNRSYLKTAGLSNAAVDILDTEYHLVRYLEVRGGKWYELSHDRYIVPILEANKKWLSQGTSPFYKDARGWHEHREDASFLYHGRRLIDARQWASENDAELSDIEREFLNASSVAESKRSSWLKSAVALLAFLLVIALGGMSYALSQREYAVAQEALATKSMEDANQLRVFAEERVKVERYLRDEATKDQTLAEKRREELEALNRKLKSQQTELEKALRVAQSARLAAVSAKKAAVAAQKKETYQRQFADLQRLLAEGRGAELATKIQELEANKKELEEAKAFTEAEKAIAVLAQKNEREQRELAEKRLADLEASQQREKIAVEQAAETKELLPQTFVQHASDYARRLGLQSSDPAIFFVPPDQNGGSIAMWNTQKQQYEVNFEAVKSRGLAEYVALEGRFMAKNYARCVASDPATGKGINPSTDMVFWQNFRRGPVDYIISTEQKLSGEGNFRPTQQGMRTYQLLKRMESLLGGNSQPVRKLSLALLDEYRCNWSERNFLQNALDINRKLGIMSESVIVEAFKNYGK